jgi:ferredoxin-type protein NapH
MKAWIRWVFLGLFLFVIAQGKMIVWLLLYGGSLLVARIWGRVYCGYVCPMNTVMMPAEALAKKTGIQNKSMPAGLKTAWLPVLALILSLAVMMIGRRRGINIPVLPLWLVLAVAATLFYRPEGFHNGLCPFGPLQEVFGRGAHYAFRVDQQTCIRCGQCVPSCPAGAMTLPEQGAARIDPALCHQCGVCAGVCPVQAIRYRS